MSKPTYTAEVGRNSDSSYTKSFYSFLTWAALFTAIYYFISSGIHFKISDFMSTQQEVEAIFNSNQLFLPYFYQDIFIRHSPLSEWTFSSVPFFFPDGLIYFVIISFIHHLKVAVLLSNATLLIFYYLLIVSIGTYLCGKESKNLFRLSVLLCIVLGCNHLRMQEVMLPLWSSHFGSTIIIFLLSLLLILKLLKATSFSKRWLYSALLFPIVFITTFSDPFFFVLIVSAAFAGLLALNLHKKINTKIAFLLFTGVFLFGVLGFLSNSYDWLNLHITSFFNLKVKVAPNITTFHLYLKPFQVVNKIFTLYYAYNPIVLMFSFGLIIIGLRYLIRGTATLNELTFFIIVSISFCLLSTIFCTLFIDKDVMLSRSLSLRHFQPFILLPTFLCLPIFLSQWKALLAFINHYYFYVIVLIIGSLVLFQPVQSPKEMLNIYPPVTQCLDHYAKEGNLFNRHGVAAYWDVRANNILSKENIHMSAVTHLKKSYHWMSTDHDYKNKEFHFVLVRKNTFPADSIIKTWGKPDTILQCTQATNYQILVYNKGFYITENHK
jgi:hypothetical protein